MKQFPVAVVNKEAVYTADDCIICGNNDYEIVFSFDAEWAEHTVKTCRFVWNGKYVDVVFTGNVCPGIIIDNARVVSIGVFTGELKTTTPAIVGCKKSILCGTDLPADPLPDVYAQLIKTINEKLNVEEVVNEALNEAKESGEFDGADGKDGKDGYTPQMGVDYFTEGDKKEMVQSVLDALPNGDEVSY